MDSVRTAIVLGAGASYCYTNGSSRIPTQANILAQMYMKIGTSSGHGAPNFTDTSGLRHSFALGEFLREDLKLAETDSADKLDFWNKLMEMGYNLETLYAHIEAKGDAYLLDDFKAILRSCVLSPAGDRQQEQVCRNHRTIAENLDPGDYVVNFNWDTLMSDALLHCSPLWFPITGFGVEKVLPVMHEKHKRYAVNSLLLLLHVHGSVALYEEADRPDEEKHFIYLGGKSYNSFSALRAVAGDSNSVAEDEAKSFLKRQPTEDEMRKIELGWIYINKRWFSPLIVPPSFYKHEYGSYYSRSIKARLHSLLPSTKQLIIAGYSFPDADSEYLGGLFVKEIMQSDTMLIIVNPENEKDAFREKVRSIFPTIKKIDFSNIDFNAFCRKID